MNLNPILLIGLPRSGSSWTGDILSRAESTHFLYEPDNEKAHLLANWYKKGIHRFPYLSANDESANYEALWNKIFSSDTLRSYDSKIIKAGRAYLRKKVDQVEKEIVDRSFHPVEKELQQLSFIQKQMLSQMSYKLNADQQLIVKSVHTGLALEWMQQLYQPKIAILFRHPASIIASCLKLNMPDVNRYVFKQNALTEKYLAPYIDSIQKIKEPLSLMGLQVAIHYYIWEQWLEKYPNWVSLTHESLCIDPLGQFKNLYKELQLNWSDNVKKRIIDLNEDGGERDISRKAIDQLGKWKQFFSAKEIDLIKEGYKILPVKHYEGLSDGY